MPTLRLFMEKFLTKYYPEQSYSYFGDLAKIRSYNTMKIFHPYYHIHFKDKPTIHTFVFIIDKLRCAKSLHIQHISILYDRFVFMLTSGSGTLATGMWI